MFTMERKSMNGLGRIGGMNRRCGWKLTSLLEEAAEVEGCICGSLEAEEADCSVVVVGVELTVLELDSARVVVKQVVELEVAAETNNCFWASRREQRNWSAIHLEESVLTMVAGASSSSSMSSKACSSSKLK